MRRSFSVTFNLVTMLGFLLAGLAFHGQERDWEIPFTWGVVLGCTWLAILVRVVGTLAGVVTRVRNGVPRSEDRRDEESYSIADA